MKPTEMMIRVQTEATVEAARHIHGASSMTWTTEVGVLSLSREARELALSSQTPTIRTGAALAEPPTVEQAAVLADEYYAQLARQRDIEAVEAQRVAVEYETQCQVMAERIRSQAPGDVEGYPHDRVREILGDVWDLIVAARKQHREELKAEIKAREAQDRAVVLAWLPESMRRQAERGLLSSATLRDQLRATIYPLIVADWPRYLRLDSSDVQHSDECYGQDVEFAVYDGESADLTPTEFANLELLESLIAGAQQDPALAGVRIAITAREHIALCPDADCPGKTCRGSAMIEVEVGGETLTREYGLVPISL